MLGLGTAPTPQRAVAWNPSAPLNRGLIGWWLMQADVFTGARIPNMVPRTILHGAKVGMSPVAADAGMHPTTRPGGFGELRFNRSTAYATIPDSAYWEFAGNFTLAWWFKMTATSSSLATQQYLLYKNSGVSPWFSLQASVTTADQIYCAFHNTTPTYADISTTLTLSANVWYQCVITRVGTALAAYVNGVNVTSGSPTLSGAFLNATALFGLGGNSLNSSLGGAMDDLRLYPTRGLAADEVRELYRASLGGYRRELVWGGVPTATVAAVLAGQLLPHMMQHAA